MGVCFGNIIMGECFGNILITLSWKEKKGGVPAVPGRWVLDWAKAEICKSTFQSNFEFLVDSVEPGGGRQPRPEWWLQSPPAPSSLRSTFGKIFWKCFRIIVSWKKTLNISCQTSPSGRNPSEGWVKSGDCTSGSSSRMKLRKHSTIGGRGQSNSEKMSLFSYLLAPQAVLL